MPVLLRALVNVDISTQVAEGQRDNEIEVIFALYIVAYLLKAKTM
jgi:hypothetical protein